jgi:hypothetical protein
VTIYVGIGEHAAQRATIHVPERGPWFADVDFEVDPDLSGRVELRAAEITLSGTIVPRSSGRFGQRTRVRIVAGAGGWSAMLPPKAYHNDAQIRARTVAQDAAREAGESIGDFSPAAERIGADYVRPSGPASRALEDVIGRALWWVGYDGTTIVGTREHVDAAEGSYEVLEHNARSRVVTLAVDQLGAVVVGSVLAAGLELPETVRELTIIITPDTARVHAWCGVTEQPGRLAGIVQSIVDRATDHVLHGIYEYRVGRMNVDRVELQAVSEVDGLPTILPISMWPGVAGAHAELTPGTHVLVQFIAGSRAKPIVTHFTGRDGISWTPAKLTFDAEGVISLGAAATNFVALANLVQSQLSSLWTALNTHIHAHGAGAGNTATPTGAPLGSAGSVAASLVKAE